MVLRMSVAQYTIVLLAFSKARILSHFISFAKMLRLTLMQSSVSCKTRECVSFAIMASSLPNAGD